MSTEPDTAAPDEPTPVEVLDPKDPLRVVGVVATPKATCVWTRGGRAACSTPEGIRVLPRDDLAAVAGIRESRDGDVSVVLTTDGLVFEIDAEGEQQELERLRGATKVACSGLRCVALVDHRLVEWSSAPPHFEVIWGQRDGQQVTDFTLRDHRMLGREHTGVIRLFTWSNHRAIRGRRVGSGEMVGGDCVVGNDAVLRCGDAAPVRVPNGLRLVTDVGWLGEDAQQEVREACGVHDGGGVSCLGPPLGPRRAEGTSYDWTRVEGIDNAVTVAGGERHACALTGEGRVKCWGATDVGQYGVQPNASTPRPIDDPGIDDPSASLVVHRDGLCLIGRNGSACTNPERHQWERFDAGVPEWVGDTQWLFRDGRRIWATDGSGRHDMRALLPEDVSGVRAVASCGEIRTDVFTYYFAFEDGTLAAADSSLVTPDVRDQWPAMHTLRRVANVRDVVDIVCDTDGLISLDKSGVVRRHETSGAAGARLADGATALGGRDLLVCPEISGEHRCRVPTPVAERLNELRGLADLRDSWGSRLGRGGVQANRICARGDQSVKCVTWPGGDERVSETALPGPVRTFGLAPAHACAQLEDGQVLCWGDPQRFRIGRFTYLTDPVDVTDRFVEAIVEARPE